MSKKIMLRIKDFNLKIRPRPKFVFNLAQQTGYRKCSVNVSAKDIKATAISEMNSF